MRKKFNIVLILMAFLVFVSCNNNEVIEPEPIEDIILTDAVEVYEADKLENSLVLLVLGAGTSSILVDKKGEILKRWDFEIALGNDLELLPDGKLLGTFKIDNPSFSFGGYGGLIRMLNPDESVFWEFNYHSEDYLAHHDVEMLPNGNILILAWERTLVADAINLGIEVDYDVYTESLIEVNPTTNEIVWEWHTKDHIIQDIDNTLPNFGVVKDNPHLINHNYNLNETGNLMHANGIDYDPDKDIIYLSVNFYSEVWVIDHSTTTIESSSHQGGNYNKGGDLIYRFGNPKAYNNTLGTRLFDNNHFPNFLEMGEPGAGNILIFNNNSGAGQSIVHELKMPTNFKLIPNADNEPDEVWSFTDSNLFYSRISGAVRLKNGNTLICEGDYGLWEISPEKEVVWKYNGNSNFWRAYNYLPTDEGIINLNLQDNN